MESSTGTEYCQLYPAPFPVFNPERDKPKIYPRLVESSYIKKYTREREKAVALEEENELRGCSQGRTLNESLIKIQNQKTSTIHSGGMSLSTRNPSREPSRERSLSKGPTSVEPEPEVVSKYREQKKRIMTKRKLAQIGEKPPTSVTSIVSNLRLFGQPLFEEAKPQPPVVQPEEPVRSYKEHKQDQLNYRGISPPQDYQCKYEEQQPQRVTFKEDEECEEYDLARGHPDSMPLLVQNPRDENLHSGVAYRSMPPDNNDLITESFPPRILKASQNDLFSQRAVVSVEDPAADNSSLGRNTSELAQQFMATNPGTHQRIGDILDEISIHNRSSALRGGYVEPIVPVIQAPSQSSAQQMYDKYSQFCRANPYKRLPSDSRRASSNSAQVTEETVMSQRTTLSRINLSRKVTAKLSELENLNEQLGTLKKRV